MKKNVIELRVVMNNFKESHPDTVNRIEQQFIEVGSGINWDKAVAAGIAYADEGEQSIEQALLAAKKHGTKKASK